MGLFGGGSPKPDPEIERMNRERSEELARLKDQEQQREKDQIAKKEEERLARRRKLRGAASLLENGYAGFGLGDGREPGQSVG